jgi:hypothetical protein
MVDRRRWDADAWRRFAIDHPIVRLLSRRIVWGIASGEGGLTATYRVAEDWTLADANDELLPLPEGATIIVAHPIEIPTPLRTTWRRLFADYAIEPPFEQLERSVFEPSSSEERSHAVERFVGTEVDHRRLTRQLAKRGWSSAAPGPYGSVTLHFRPFPSADVTAALFHTPCLVGRLRESLRVALRELTFLPGAHVRLRDDDPVLATCRRIGAVSPIVYSETIRDVVSLT